MMQITWGVTYSFCAQLTAEPLKKTKILHFVIYVNNYCRFEAVQEF